ncbi:MAG: recombinase family protein [Pseudomonadota bacterium]
MVNSTEAAQVRQIFELYLEKKSVRSLKSELDRRGLKSKLRRHKNGRVTGGGPFSRGHLYRVLANPIYIGKLPHKGTLHEGKHQAIVDAELWDRVQAQLLANKCGTEKASVKHRSLLAGRLVTSDGHKLIPSHAVKQGRRYRYYIEQRLVQDEGVGTKGARYAALEVENAVLAILQHFLNNGADVISALRVDEATPTMLRQVAYQAKELARSLTDSREASFVVADMLFEVVVGSTELKLRLHREKLATLLGAIASSDNTIHTITSACKLARRGQDLKFTLPLLEDHNKFARQDPSLVQAVAKAHLWWGWLKSGDVESLSEIARREGIDKPKVTRLLRLAFLSPQLVRQIRKGEQPTGVTVKSLTREHELPLSWQEQETLLELFQ